MSSPATLLEDPANASVGPYCLLPGEDRQDYLDLERAYLDEFQPTTAHEVFLVTEMLEARWKLFRIERLQNEAFQQMLDSREPGESSDAAIVTALGQRNCVLDRLERYAAQAQRSYHRAHREMERILRRDARVHEAALDAELERLRNAPPPASAGPRREELQNEAKLQNEANSRPAPAARTPYPVPSGPTGSFRPPRETPQPGLVYRAP